LDLEFDDSLNEGEEKEETFNDLLKKQLNQIKGINSQEP